MNIPRVVIVFNEIQTQRQNVHLMSQM